MKKAWKQLTERYDGASGASDLTDGEQTNSDVQTILLMALVDEIRALNKQIASEISDIADAIREHRG